MPGSLQLLGNQNLWVARIIFASSMFTHLRLQPACHICGEVVGGAFVGGKKCAFNSDVLTSTDKGGAGRPRPKSRYPQADSARRCWPGQDVSTNASSWREKLARSRLRALLTDSELRGLLQVGARRPELYLENSSVLRFLLLSSSEETQIALFNMQDPFFLFCFSLLNAST